MRLEGYNIIITGAAGDIGKATAKRLVSDGASVLLVDIQTEGLKTCCEEVQAEAAKLRQDTASKSPQVLYQPADVTKEDDVKAYVNKAIETFGVVHGFFNNAGIQGSFKPVTEYDADEFQQILNVNTYGIFLGVKYVGEQMRQQGYGSIVNTASLAGVVAPPNMVAYSASKFGVIGITKSSSRDLAASGVRINCVSPDLIGDCKMWYSQVKGQITATRGGQSASEPSNEEIQAKEKEMLAGVPMQRLGGLDEVASVVSFLISSDSSYMSGKNVEIDGGRM
eukprot:gb/GECG01010468.1/.p1 GENE.gb/GECG01010468.1/~~gb/GECG01010468.1/.p1  ORF type:complete len:280 (+),score=46.59 gb/GECG01010468.1/:1-840(+)